MATHLFALIDCDNFFVSCERLFRPGLQTKPVVVLSSNDGCVVSRSKEAKALGVPMGAPVFEYRQLFKTQGVIQFSANFELYGDISERIIRLLTSVTPMIEVYSVDEAFLDLSTLTISDLQGWGKALRDRILHEVGVPVSIGIAPTKTLAKLASEYAKKTASLAGVLNLPLQLEKRRPYLQTTAIQDVWGIGRRLGPRLKAEGIYTALDLASLRPRYAQQLMGIHGRQLVAELSGQCCHPLERYGKVRHSIMHGRMFGEDTNQFLVIEAAIASLANKAVSHLRTEGLLAQSAAVQLSTNRHKPGYQRLMTQLNFQTPTADSGELSARLVAAIQPSFNPNKWYHRLNILLYDLVSVNGLQSDLFDNIGLEIVQSATARLRAVDAINSRYGRHTVYYAAEDLSNSWYPKRALRSPRYTTHWQELPLAHLL
jgi:DNA polymerase V